MRMKIAKDWIDMGPSSGGRPYHGDPSLFDMPSVEDITRRTGCVVCNDETQGGRTFCGRHRKWLRFSGPRFTEAKAA